jgi:GntR family transcriptional repressor for pyruvate dehydrogenase complex
VSKLSSFSALQPGVKLAEQVADALEAEIKARRLEADEKLPSEATLVQQFAVSRTVIREAISRLKSRKVVYARQGAGVFVAAQSIEPLDFSGSSPAASREAVLQIVEVRRALEAEVAELAAQRRTPDDMQAIDEALTAIAVAVAQGQDGAEEDVRFHRAVARASHNPYMIRTLEYLSRLLQDATRVTRANEARRADFAKAVNREHLQIVEAIREAQPAAARKAATQHMKNAAHRIEQADPAFWAEDGARLASPLLRDTL